MCWAGKFFCSRCEAFIGYSGDEDDDVLFRACENLDECLDERFININYVDYYAGLCDDCEASKKRYMKQVLNKKTKRGKKGL